MFRFLALAGFALAAVGSASAQQDVSPSTAPFVVQNFPQYLAGSWRNLDESHAVITRVYTVHSDGSLVAEVQYCKLEHGVDRANKGPYRRDECADAQYMNEQYTFDGSSSRWSMSSAPDAISQPAWQDSQWLPIAASFQGIASQWQQGNTWTFDGSSKRIKTGDVVEKRVVYVALTPDVFQIDWQTLVNGTWQHDAKSFGRLNHS